MSKRPNREDVWIMRGAIVASVVAAIAIVAAILSAKKPPCLREECHSVPGTMIISNGKNITVMPTVRTECTCLEYAPVDAGQDAPLDGAR